MDTLELIGQALRLERTPFTHLLASRQNLLISLAVVFFAGLSRGIGQSLVLFLNRIKPRRFTFSLLVSALLYVSGFLFSALSIWLLADVLFNKTQHFRLVVSVVGLSYAPYLFGIFILTPYLGSFFSLVLSVWRLATLLIALEVALFLSLWEALACSLLSWLLIEVAERTIGRPIQWLSGSARHFAAGKKLEDIDTVILKRNNKHLHRRRK